MVIGIIALKYFFLWLHLFSAILFIGGSFFMWIVIVPASKEVISNEAERTIIVAKISKKFARITPMLLITLIATGIINATWYLPIGASFSLYNEYLVIAMVALTSLLILLMYGPGRYYGRMISRLAGEGKVAELKKLRRKSSIISAINLGIMVAITIVAVLM